MQEWRERDKEGKGGGIEDLEVRECARKRRGEGDDATTKLK